MSRNSESQLVQYDSECYEVEKIVDKKWERGKPFYMVKWKGWDSKDNTWEPLKNLKTVLNLVEEFDKHQTLKNKSNPNKPDKKIISEPKPIQKPEPQFSKKTKPIQKDKKARKTQTNKSQGEISESSLQQASQKSSSSKRSQRSSGKKNQSKQVEKKAGSFEQNRYKMKQVIKETLKEKVREKDSDKQKLVKQANQKQREKQKQRAQEPELKKRVQSNSGGQQKQEQISREGTKQFCSNMAIQHEKTKLVEIICINYHIIVSPEHSSQVPRIYYNVDRRNKITNKRLAVVDLPAEQLMDKNVTLVVEYLENFVREVQLTAMEQKKYEKNNNSQTLNHSPAPQNSE